MNDETLNKANGIKHEIANVEKMLQSIEKNNAVEITFSNGSYCCCSTQSLYLSDDEVAKIKNNIVELIRLRAQARLDRPHIRQRNVAIQPLCIRLRI